MLQRKDTILIVDDTASNCDELKKIFKDNYHLIDVDSGAAAITYLNNAPYNPSLILADYDMPAINGTELLQALKESALFHSIPVILMFDHENDDAIAQAIMSGSAEILIRPMNINLLKKRVENVIKLYPVIYYRNVMENQVLNEVDNCMEHLGMCTCPVCRNDLIALTLNHLPPKYVNTDKGEILSKVETLSSDMQTNLLTCITSAAEKIKKNPRHKKKV